MGSDLRDWLIDLVLGGILGGAVGAVAAVNFVIFSGIDGGYEASVVEVFRQNPVIGSVTIALLAAGPVLGASIARRTRKRRNTP